MGRTRSVAALSLLAGVPNLLAFTQLREWQTLFTVGASAMVSAFGFYATFRLIPVIQRLTVAKGLWGEALSLLPRPTHTLSTHSGGVY